MDWQTMLPGIAGTVLGVLAMLLGGWVARRGALPPEVGRAIDAAMPRLDALIETARQTATPWDDVVLAGVRELLLAVRPVPTLAPVAPELVAHLGRVVAGRVARARGSTQAPRPPLAMALLAVAVLAMMLPAPARAQPLRVCLVGCEAPSDAAGSSLLAGGPVAISPVLYLRPSLGLTVAVRDGLTRAWTVGLEPGLGYGIAWCPPGWRRLGLTPELLALDLHASGGLTEGVMRGRVLALLTLGGVVSVGAGLDAALGSGAVPDRAGLALAIGARWAL